MSEKGNLRQMEKRLKALANRKRLEILQFLKREHSAYVTEIARAIQLTVPATSDHLQILYAANIVITHKRSLYVTYRLSLNQQSPIKDVLRLL